MSAAFAGVEKMVKETIKKYLNALFSELKKPLSFLIREINKEDMIGLMLK